MKLTFYPKCNKVFVKYKKYKFSIPVKYVNQLIQE
jgi:hypothetical protein